MNYKKLSEICTIKMGQSPNSASYNDSGDGIPFFQGNADFGERYPITRVWCSSPTKTANAGDILISVRAPIGAVNYATEKCCIGRGLAAITPDSRKASPEYIYWLLKWKSKELNTKGTGSTFKAINREILENILVPDIPLKQQILYAGVLEKNYRIIQQHRKQLSALDNLIKSRFVEMFGTYNNSPFPVKTLEDLCEQIKDGTHQTPSYTDDKENGFLFLSSKDVTSRYIDWDHPMFITPKLHEQLYKRISPRKGDILLAKNGTTGVAAIVDRESIFDIYVSLALLRPHKNINVKYLWQAINMPETKKQFDVRLKGIGVPNLHLGEIKQAKIVVPPLEIQNQFAELIEQAERTKHCIKESRTKTKILFESLMSKYFC